MKWSVNIRRFAFCIYIAVALIACAKKEVRTDEEIDAVFNQHRMRLIEIYAEFLKEKSDLGGFITFEVTIEPSGEVSECRVHTSEIANPAVGEAVCGGIKAIDFGSKNTDAKTIKYPMGFFG